MMSSTLQVALTVLTHAALPACLGNTLLLLAASL